MTISTDSRASQQPGLCPCTATNLTFQRPGPVPLGWFPSLPPPAPCVPPSTCPAGWWRGAPGPASAAGEPVSAAAPACLGRCGSPWASTKHCSQPVTVGFSCCPLVCLRCSRLVQAAGAQLAGTCHRWRTPTCCSGPWRGCSRVQPRRHWPPGPPSWSPSAATPAQTVRGKPSHTHVVSSVQERCPCACHLGCNRCCGAPRMLQPPCQAPAVSCRPQPACCRSHSQGSCPAGQQAGRQGSNCFGCVTPCCLHMHLHRHPGSTAVTRVPTPT